MVHQQEVSLTINHIAIKEPEDVVGELLIFRVAEDGSTQVALALSLYGDGEDGDWYLGDDEYQSAKLYPYWAYLPKVSDQYVDGKPMRRVSSR